MAHTNAFINLNDLVDRFMLRKKLSTDDAVLYFEHASEAYRRIRRQHSNESVTAKVSISSLGIIEMPDDMMGFINLVLPINGEFWSFTDRPNMVNTTTLVAGVETRDSDQGEQVAIDQDQTTGYGSKGAINDYSRTIDWEARRIFVDGIKSDTAVLIYESSGLNLDGNTLVPEDCVPVIEAYIMWQKTDFDGSSMNEKLYRKNNYEEELRNLRILNFMPTGDELRDILFGTSTQAPTR